jgi:alpha-tubulin suppressor-like RCC1 family protein/uncharacterized protein YjdB
MPATLSCPRCGEPLPEGATACGHCGTGVHLCPVCAGLVVDSDRFCGQCGTPQSASGVGAAAAAEPSPWDEVVERLRKATLGDFVISRELGRGGMAAVYLAHDIALNRKVAIKVMSPGLLMGPGMVERFKQEAVTVANLSHPHIITIHAVRQTAGLHFFVMKLIPGRSLERIVRDTGPLPVTQVQAMLFQVGSALAYAHRRGVIHRDIKPGNILLDEDGNAIVTDFGIAKVRESPTHTMTGATVGTPAYMSPEQCWSREVTGASDQYSLGIVAYEMLTGVPPFTGPTLGILRAHVEDAPRPITEVRPDCPPEVAAAIERMLAKEPGDRWPDVMHAVTGLGGRHLPEHDAMREQLAALAMQNAAPETSPAFRTPVSPVPTTAAVPPAAAAPPAPSPPPRPSPITEVLVTAPTPRGAAGASLQLQATGRDAHGDTQSGARIRWSSSNPAVATVSPSGMVTLIAPGSVTITASSDEGVAGTTLLEVTPPAPASAEVIGAPAELYVGDSAHLGVGVRDARGAVLPAGAVQWATSDGAIASVSPSGVVRALAPGSAVVSVTVDGGVAARATVAIRPVPVASLTLTGAPPALLPGETARLAAVARDAGGHELGERTVRWQSDTPAVASVTADGTVAAVAPGTARVVATCEGRSAAAEFRVNPAPVAALTIAVPRRGVRVGRRIRLTAEARDARGRPLPGRAIRWSTQHPALIQVDSASGEARGLEPGAAVVLALCEGVQASATVEVFPAPPPRNLRPLALGAGAVAAVALAVWLWPRGRTAPGTDGPPVATVTVAPPARTLRAGDSLQLAASLLAADGTALEERPVAWRSSDTAVATVSAAGLVVARAPGSAAVAASSEGRAGQASLRVLAAAPAAVAIAGPGERAAEVGDTFSLSATLTDAAGGPVVGAGPRVEWRSSRPAVATVSAEGRVTAVGEGAATLTAVSAGRRASVAVRVTAPPPASLAVTPAARNGSVGDTVRLAATMLTAAGDTLRGRVPAWESGNPAVATVSAGGVVTIVGPGRATITATSGGLRGSAVITGAASAASRATVATVDVTAPAERLEQGRTLRVTATPRSAAGAALGDRTVAWRSSRPEVATVTSDGVVSGRSAGQTQITATSEGASAALTLTVVATPPVDEPPPAGAAGGFRAIAAGGFSCALDPSGAASCWGQGRPTPAPVGGGRFTAITAGLGFACGLAGNGQAFCWGANGKGQLGDGTTKGRPAPTLVSADLTFSQLAAGDAHACGLTPGGNIYCWGDNGEGQLGDGSKDGRLRPTQIRESQPWKQVVAGGIHSCGLTRDGRAYCWGDGFSGELGHGMMESSLEPVPVTGGLTFTALTAGKRHTCGLTAGKDAYCWGDNRDGQLGTGGREDTPKPAAVAGELQFGGLSAGAGHTCGVTAGGRAMCWGNNGAGQIGDGGSTARTAPAAVRSDAVFLQVSAGVTHSCGVTREQQVLCWGGNNRGQLGDGTQTNRNVPGAIGGPAGPQ